METETTHFHRIFQKYITGKNSDTSISKSKPKPVTDSSEDSPAAKKTRHRSNYSCEIVVNGLQEVTQKFEKTCKSVTKVLKASPRTKYKTHFCVTAVPEFMERIHSLDFSNRIIFLDSANRFNCNVFVLMVDSHVGALPFGFFITSCKSPGLMEQTFRALNEILPNNAFNTPPFMKVVITGIDNAEHTSLSRSFSTVKAYIGAFHLLREVWKFLWDRDNNVLPSHRTVLFKLFENILHSPSERKFQTNILAYVDDETYKKYPAFQKYFSNLLKKKDLWGLDFRVRGHVPYDKNVLTSEKHVLKENILHKCKTCSVSGLFEFLCTTFCDYYRKKILDATSGSVETLSELRYLSGEEELVADLIVAEVSGDEVQIVNTARKGEYYVNKELGTCTCVMGKLGTPCVHQYVMAKKFNPNLFRIATMSEDQKSKYNYLANGCEMNKIAAIADVIGNTRAREIEETNDDSSDLTEYVIVSEYDDEESVNEAPQRHSTEDCIRAIETFWMKLSPYTEDHADQIYSWITSMNDKLDEVESFDSVMSILKADSRT